MQKQSSLDKLLRTSNQSTSDLVSLDFKAQSLQKFLQNIVSLVNQHGHRINQLQHQKISVQRVKNGNIKIINSYKLPRSILVGCNAVGIQSPTVVQQTYQQTIQSLQSTWKQTQKTITHLYSSQQKTKQQLSALYQKLPTLLSSSQYSQSLQKVQQSCKSYTDNENQLQLERVCALEGRLAKRIGDVENGQREVEKNTLWRVGECEDMIRKRVTAEYVDRALQQFQARILAKVQGTGNTDNMEVKYGLQGLKDRVEGLVKYFNECELQNKGSIKKLQQQVKLLYPKSLAQQYIEQTKETHKKLVQKIQALQCQPKSSIIQNSFQQFCQQYNKNYQTQCKKICQLEQTIKSLNECLSQAGTGSHDHKLCMIDGDVRRLKDASKNQDNRLATLEEEIKIKMIMLEERVMTVVGLFKGQDNWVNRDQLNDAISRVKQPVSQRMNQMQSLMHQLNGKMAKMETFEKATKRKIKQLTKGQQLSKILDMKMNNQIAQTHFNSIKLKMQAIQSLANKLKVESESNEQFLNHLRKIMSEPEQGINVIGSRTRMFPAKCLGCGSKHNPVYENNMMQGTDGKYYKVDLKTYSNDQREVFGVVPSQVALFDNSSTIKKPKVISINRSNQSKSHIRPSSAKCS